jgi:hypothetical protein
VEGLPRSMQPAEHVACTLLTLGMQPMQGTSEKPATLASMQQQPDLKPEPLVASRRGMDGQSAGSDLRREVPREED